MWKLFIYIKTNYTYFIEFQNHLKTDNLYRLLLHVNLFLNSTDKHQFRNIFFLFFQNSLPNFKSFSLTCYHRTEQYDNLVVPLLRRMSNLEELTLYIHILGGLTFISGTHLDNEMLIHMPQLHTFTFYTASENFFTDLPICISNFDIQRTFTNIKHGQMSCMVDYLASKKMICRVFSLPFKFHRLKQITNNIPNLVFNSVTHLELCDKDPFKYEFFIRLVQTFPFLKKLLNILILFHLISNV
jgi:hypothetical protein